MSTAMGILYDLFLKPQKESQEVYWRILGLTFLMVGIGLGSFFLFETLVPLIGYVESGASISVLLILMGSSLLLLNRKKQLVPQVPSLPPIQDVFKGIDMENELKNHAGKIMLLAFGIGFTLSQLTNVKKLSEFYKLIK
jgi:cytochrome c biogenesis protein CcdA